VFVNIFIRTRLNLFKAKMQPTPAHLNVFLPSAEYLNVYACKIHVPVPTCGFQSDAAPHRGSCSVHGPFVCSPDGVGAASRMLYNTTSAYVNLSVSRSNVLCLDKL